MSDDVIAACLRAVGYLELGLPEDCLAELEGIPVASSEVVQLRVAALFDLKRWIQAAGICVPMLEQEPELAVWWIHAAYALRRARSLDEAEPILRAALKHHPDHVLVCYNLACYTCVQGRHDEARDFLTRAMNASRDEVLKMAGSDPDLEGIEDWVRQQSASDPKVL